MKSFKDIEINYGYKQKLYLVSVKEIYVVILSCKIRGLVIKENSEGLYVEYLLSDYNLIHDSKGQVIQISNLLKSQTRQDVIDNIKMSHLQFIFPYGLSVWKIFSSKQEAQNYIKQNKGKIQ